MVIVLLHVTALGRIFRILCSLGSSAGGCGQNLFPFPYFKYWWNVNTSGEPQKRRKLVWSHWCDCTEPIIFGCMSVKTPCSPSTIVDPIVGGGSEKKFSFLSLSKDLLDNETTGSEGMACAPCSGHPHHPVADVPCRLVRVTGDKIMPWHTDRLGVKVAWSARKRYVHGFTIQLIKMSVGSVVLSTINCCLSILVKEEQKSFECVFRPVHELEPVALHCQRQKIFQAKYLIVLPCKCWKVAFLV